MTFGQIKSIIENSLIESYKNEGEFKKSLREFKHNVLSNKSMSKIYSLYDQLSTPQGLSESDAKEYLEEGVNLIQKLLGSIKLPKTLSESTNEYSDIDTLVYLNKINLS
jgi:alcohol dehydrogenase class IV